MDSIPPHDLEMEQAVLGGVLIEDGILARVAEILEPASFFLTTHQTIFAAMLGLLRRHEPVDLLTLQQELCRRGELDLVRGSVTLAALIDQGATFVNTLAYARTVKEHAIRRDLISVSHRVTTASYNPQADIGALLEQMGTRMADASHSFCSLRGEVGKETNLSPVTAADLLASSPQSVAWVWNRFIPEGRLVLLTAFMKVGKSLLAYKLAIAVAQGRPFLGFPTTRGGVLILAVEEHPDDVRRRLHRFGVQPTDPIYVHAGRLESIPKTLNDVRAFITNHGIKLVILDTLGRYWNVPDENDNASVIRAVSPLLDLTRETGAAILLVHHERKTGGEDGRAVRGATALLGLVDQALSLDRRQGGQPNHRVLRTVGRYDETPRELVIALIGNDYRTLGTAEELKLETATEKVWQALSEKPQRVEKLVDETTLHEKAVRAALLTLGDKVIREGRGTKGNPRTYRRPHADSIRSQGNPIGQKPILVAKEALTRTVDGQLEDPEEEWA